MKRNLFVMTVLFFGMNLQAEAVQYGKTYYVASNSTDSTHKGKFLAHKVWTSIEKGHFVPTDLYGGEVCTFHNEDHNLTVMGPCSFAPEGDSIGNTARGSSACKADWKIMKASGGKNVSDGSGDVHFGDTISLKVGDKERGSGFLTGDKDTSVRVSTDKDAWEEFTVINPANPGDTGVVQKHQQVALQAKSNGLYLSARENGDVRAQADKIGEWEVWRFD